MTHGRAANPHWDDNGERIQLGLKDVLTPGGYTGLNWVKAPAYGWNKAKALAAKGDRLGGPIAPDNNADTLALFASSRFACRFVAPAKLIADCYSLQVDGRANSENGQRQG